MDEKQIRAIIQDEIQRNYRSGSPFVAPHKHNGNDNLRINQSDIQPSIKANGDITMATEGRTYTLNLVADPSVLMFYGTAVNNNGSSPTIKAIVNGNAQLSQGYIFTGVNTSSVAPGPLQNIIQCSNSMIIDTTSLGNAAVRASELHLIYVQDHAGTLNAVATVTSFTNTSINIKVETLASGWQIIGNFLVI